MPLFSLALEATDERMSKAQYLRRTWSKCLPKVKAQDRLEGVVLSIVRFDYELIKSWKCQSVLAQPFADPKGCKMFWVLLQKYGSDI